VRLLDYTAPADTSRIDLSVSHINFTQYSRIDLLFRAPNSGTEVYLRVNGAAAGYYYPLDGDSQPLSSDNQRSYLADIPALSGCVATGRIQLLWPASGAKIGCYFNVFASNGTNVSSRSGTLFTEMRDSDPNAALRESALPTLLTYTGHEGILSDTTQAETIAAVESLPDGRVVLEPFAEGNHNYLSEDTATAAALDKALRETTVAFLVEYLK